MSDCLRSDAGLRWRSVGSCGTMLGSVDGAVGVCWVVVVVVLRVLRDGCCGDG